MTEKYFTPEQVEMLKANPYIDKVSNKAITYSEGYKEHFILELHTGKQPTQIFREAGLDPRIIGRDRIWNFTRRVRKMSERTEGFKDLRSENSGRPRTKERSLEEENAYLKHQVALQKQQIEALKKMNAIKRKAAGASHKNSSNSSKG